MPEIVPSQHQLHNLVVSDGSVQVRPGYRNVHDFSSAVIYGFSEECGATSEIQHYVFTRETSGDGYCAVYTEQFQELFSIPLGKIPENCPIYSGVQNSQILINGPGLNYPLYGIVGGGLTPAIKEDSINTDTTALTIPLGIVCSFGDRFAIVDETGTNIIFSDPGVVPKTYVAENIVHIQGGGTIYHLEQTDDGVLAVFTSSGIYGLDRTALGQGQAVVGFISRIPGYEANDYRCAANANGVLLGLVRDGVANILNQFQLLDIPANQAKHRLTRRSRPADYRTGVMHKTTNGALVAYPERCLVIDAKNDFAAWHYTETATTVKGVLKTRDGEDIYLLEDKAVLPIGDMDDLQSSVDGYACINLEPSAELSTLIRHLTTSSDNPGQKQYSFIRGFPGTSTAALTPASGIVIGSSTWSTTGSLEDRELTSVRHDVDVRTDQISMELGAQGSQRRLGTFDVRTKPSGGNRP